jgi:DNA-binding transcriptional LysR family regulator
MSHYRNALSPENLHLLATVASEGSLAAAARQLGLVPSALTYRLRQMEEQLDVLLVDRSSRRAQLTPAGHALKDASAHLLTELESVALRVKRVATGWEAQLVIVADDVINKTPLLELLDAFYQLGAPTRIKLQVETLSGTTESLTSGVSDLALGIMSETAQFAGIRHAPLGDVPFVFAVAKHHPLANAPEPLTDAQRAPHRVISVADSGVGGSAISVGILAGQDTLAVPSMALKLAAQLAGLGCGYLPEPLARPHIASGALVAKAVEQPARVARVAYAWRAGASGQTGRALQWWLDQLKHPTTRAALSGG